MDKLRVLGVAGSLRKESYNRAVLRTAVELAPEEMDIETFDIAGIPPFNQDEEQNQPEHLREFKAKIKRADGLIFVTPEYNYSIPGVLKNAIDAASRPYGDNPFYDKPVAIIGASPGRIGTARAQYHLRQTCVFLNMHPMNQPEVMITFADEKIDDNGKLVDQQTREIIRKQMEAYVIWIRRLKGV